MAAATKGTTAVVTSDMLRSIKADIEKTGKTSNREAGIVTSSDIERMKRSAKVMTQQEQTQAKKISDEQKQQQQAASKARKTKMVGMDKDRATKIPPTQIEIEQSKKAEGLLNKAQFMLDEEHDDVKHMNQMVLYSKVVTVRDKQL